MRMHDTTVASRSTIASSAAVSRLRAQGGDVHRSVSHPDRGGSLRPRKLAVVLRRSRIMSATQASPIDQSRDAHDRRAVSACLDRAPRARQMIA